MIVEDLLVRKTNQLYTVSPDQTVRQAAAIFAARNIGIALVVDDAGGLAGVFSERDLVSFLSDMGGTVLDLPVKELMTRSVVTCDPTTAISEALSLMALYRIRHLPVVKDGATIGLISIRDLLEARLEVQEEQFSAVIRAKRGASLAQQARELANRAQAALMKSVDNDFRTPLRRIVEACDLLGREIADLPERDSAKLGKHSGQIKREARALLETIEGHVATTPVAA